MKTRPATSAAALLAATVLSSLAAAPAQAQQPAASPSPTDPAGTAATPSASPAPAPAQAPMPILQGPNYETLRALAAALQTETQHALQGALEGTRAGRPMRMFMPGIRMFARRTQWFRESVDKYQAQPFDVVNAVSMMHTRATMLGRRMHNNPGLEHTWEDWDASLDLLDRMQKLLAGEKVEVPPPHTPRPAPTPAAVAPSTVPPEAADRNPRRLPAVPAPPATGASPAPAARPSPSPSATPTPSPVPR